MKTPYVQAQLSRITDWPVKARQAKYQAAQLPSVCGVHRRALERFFRDKFGKPPKAWTEEQRQRELESLLQTDLPLKEIAWIACYKQPSHMTRLFRNHHGMSPSQWRIKMMRISSPA